MTNTSENPARGTTCRLSTEDVVTRLSEKGFTLVGEYEGRTRSRCTVKCSKGHLWTAIVGNLLKNNGTGCPHCIGKAQLTMGEVQRRLDSRKIKFLGTTPRVSRHAKFECEKGHTWSARLSSVMSDTSCPHCSSNSPLTLDEVNSRISARGYMVSGDYANAGTRTEFECSKGHKWGALPDNILRGKGCPSCAEHGFNPTHPSYFYTVHIISKEVDYVGFGITRDIDTRYANHVREIKRKSFYPRLLDLFLFDSGHDAKALEDLVKENFRTVDTGIKGFRNEAIVHEDYLGLLKMMDTLAITV